MEASVLPVDVGMARAPATAALLRLRSDEQLVALFRAGSEEAFGVVHDRFQTRLLAYIRRMLPPGPRANAEDVLQDVFLRAYSALRADERPVALRAWLYRVAHNRCVDELRRPGAQPAELIEQEGDPRLDPALAAERRERLRRLVVDLGRLPEQQRSALLMRELEGFTYKELADALGVSAPAVKSLLVRARTGLAEAALARDTSCGDIRDDLAGTRDRRVRTSARARRHLRDCGGCRSFDRALRATSRDLAALLPGPGLLGMIASLLGGGVTAGGGTAAGGGAVGLAGGGMAGATATKVAVAMCCVVATAGGAATVERSLHRVTDTTPPARTAPAARPLQAVPAAGAPSSGAMDPAPAAIHAAPTTSPASDAVVSPADAPGPTDAIDAPGSVAGATDPATGGTTSPEEPAGDPAAESPLTGIAVPDQIAVTQPPAQTRPVPVTSVAAATPGDVTATATTAAH